MYLEALLVGSVGDTVLYFAAEHHHGAVHVVVNHVFELWKEGVFVYQVEVDVVVSGNLNSNVPLSERNKACQLESVVQLPFHSLCFFV